MKSFISLGAAPFSMLFVVTIKLFTFIFYKNVVFLAAGKWLDEQKMSKKL